MNDLIKIILHNYYLRKEIYTIDLSKVKRIFYIRDVEEAIVVEYKDGSVQELSPGWDYSYRPDHYYEIFNENDLILSDDLRSLLKEDRQYGDMSCDEDEFEDEDLIPYTFIVKFKRNKQKDNAALKAVHKRYL